MGAYYKMEEDTHIFSSIAFGKFLLSLFFLPCIYTYFVLHRHSGQIKLAKPNSFAHNLLYHLPKKRKARYTLLHANV